MATVQSFYRTDRDIQAAVLSALRWDSCVNAADIGVTVNNGAVTLLGVVDSYPERIAAAAAAHQVAGVRDVANDIAVRAFVRPERTDTDIAKAVRHALEWDVLVPEERITTTVSSGVVTLEGEVNSWYQRHDAERAVRQLTGVRGIINRITIHPPAISATSVREAIEEALARQAEREAGRIAVQVDDDKVTLTGVVRSWREKEAVLGVAGHAPGVVELVDHLRVDPSA